MLVNCPKLAVGIRYSTKVTLLNILPTLLLTGGMCGDFSGGLLLLASILVVFKIEFSIKISSKSGKNQ